MLRTLAIIFGLIFLVLGVLGFFPSFAPNGMLFGAFHINFLHNVFHLFTGIIALWVGFSSAEGSKLYFQVFGIVYLLFALLGFSYVEKPLFGLIANNIADSWLHVLFGAVYLYFGFGIRLPQKPK